MGKFANFIIMIVSLVSVFILTIGLGSVADAVQYKPYQLKSVPVSVELQEEFDKLSRYCGSYNGYRPSGGYYRPTGGSSGFNLGSLIGPAVFGLAAVGGAAAIASALGITIGK